jgi:hypothetical protein
MFEKTSVRRVASPTKSNNESLTEITVPSAFLLARCGSIYRLCFCACLTTPPVCPTVTATHRCHSLLRGSMRQNCRELGSGAKRGKAKTSAKCMTIQLSWVVTATGTFGRLRILDLVNLDRRCRVCSCSQQSILSIASKPQALVSACGDKIKPQQRCYC